MQNEHLIDSGCRRAFIRRAIGLGAMSKYTYDRLWGNPVQRWVPWPIIRMATRMIETGRSVRIYKRG